MRRCFLRLALCLALLGCFPSEALALSAKSALVLDPLSGQVLFEQNADAPSLVASTTKILTALVICRTCDLDETVQIPPEAVGVEGSSLYLKVGERLTVRELLYGLLLSSGNDAAAALALHCAGSLEAFAEKMNACARELGMQSSHFVNPHGLDAEGHYSTARDLALLGAAAMEEPELRTITATRSIHIGARSLTNHNKLLWRSGEFVGVKTGYTRAAGRILVSAAERAGRRLILVTISDPDDWNDHEALLRDAMAQFSETELLPEDAGLGKLPLLSGRILRLRAAEDFRYPLLPGEQPLALVRLKHLPWDEEGEAQVCFFLHGKQIGSAKARVEVVNEEETAKATFGIWPLLPTGSGEAD